MAAIGWMLTAFLLSLIFTQGQAIDCWKCDLFTENCNDDFVTDESRTSVSKLTDCEYCTKTKVFYASGVHAVVRDCYHTDDKGESELVDNVCSTCNVPETCGAHKETCYCRGDLCNHGNRGIPALAVMFGLLVLIKLL